MVVLLDLDEDDLVEPSIATINEQYRRRLQGGQHMAVLPLASGNSEHHRPNPNLNGFSAALACYP